MTLRKRRAAAIGTTTAIALALSGAFLPAVASANDEGVAPTSGPEFDAQAKSLLADADVQAVASDGKGGVVVFATAAESELEGAANDYVESNSNVTVRVIDAPFTTSAETDVVGGAGYFAFNDPAEAGGLCSVGFSGWTPAGDPALISAGHCTGDGTLVNSVLTLPTGDPAGGGNPDNSDVELIPDSAYFASLAFSQYGGPGNTPGTSGSLDSVDISTWDIEDLDYTPLAEITDWTTSDEEDLSLSTIPVRAVGSPQLGAVAKSGRTTGFTQGQITAVNGWAEVSDRFVYGFAAELLSAEGDSGGAIYQGNTAVGVLSGGSSAGGVELTWGADLQAGLARTGGYTVALFVDAPVSTTPAEVGLGGAITGTGPANHTLVYSIDGAPEAEVAIDAAGNWSFPAPDALGTAEITVYAYSGFNASAAVTFDVDVLPAAPVIVSPANGARIVDEVTEISGTGTAGAELELSIGNGSSGDFLTTEVAPDGTWSFDLSAGLGTYSVAAIQIVDGIESAVAESVFSVIPAAPVIDTPIAGGTYASNAVPASISGRGIDGATVTVSVDGTAVGTATVTGGAWSVARSGALAAGAHTVTATQTVSEIASDPASVSFTVSAAPAGGGGGTLPATGMSDVAPYLGVGAFALLAGVALLAFRRYRVLSARD